MRPGFSLVMIPARVFFHGAYAYAQLFGHSSIALPIGEHPHQLLLTGGEALIRRRFILELFLLRLDEAGKHNRRSTFGKKRFMLAQASDRVD